MTERNILIDPLPTAVEVEGREYFIASDFRTGILFELLMQDKDATETEKALGAFQLWYPQEIPSNADAAADELVWFYSCGKKASVTERKQQQKAGIPKRIYDFDIDAPLIYSAFLAQYHIDLQDIEYLHWWKFSALFEGLNEENEISKIMQYRAIDLSEITNKAEKKHYAKLQAKYRLPDNRSTAEKEAIAGALFAGMAGGRK